MDFSLNKIYCEDCMVTIQRMIENNIKVNIILTSPPYNTATKSNTDPYIQRYESHIDTLTDEEYINRTLSLFNGFNDILKENGVILYNMSYSTEKPMLMYETIYNIFKNTNFNLTDTIIWKKKSALPDNRSKNRLTRITEFIFVFCRKGEEKTYQCNKELIKISERGFKYYTPIYNVIYAKNNDGSNKLNKATYSTELCLKLLDIYSKENDIVYDPYMGIGTTAKAALIKNLFFIGSELSQKQVDYFNSNNLF